MLPPPLPPSAHGNTDADLNHVVHACSHPGWREEPYESEEEMFVDMHLYIERLVSVTR